MICIYLYLGLEKVTPKRAYDYYAWHIYIYICIYVYTWCIRNVYNTKVRLAASDRVQEEKGTKIVTPSQGFRRWLLAANVRISESNLRIACSICMWVRGQD